MDGYPVKCGRPGDDRKVGGDRSVVETQLGVVLLSEETLYFREVVSVLSTTSVGVRGSELLISRCPVFTIT